MMSNLGVKDLTGCPNPTSWLKVSYEGIHLIKISTWPVAFGIITSVRVEDTP